MARIRILDETIALRIAAGEVVERPASVVKELVENALDAGAGVVRVEVTGGGLERITVLDDGCGMDRDDAELALQRHATSKIAAAADLEAIRTLGFRGEALPSIAAVSRLVLRTRPADSATGTELEAEGGRILAVRVAGGPPGTVVTVSDLFYNTPVRKKFLRNASQERALVSETVGRLALSRPDVVFRLTSNGREVLNTSGTGDLLDTIAAVFGGGVAREMLPVELALPGLEVSGYIGRPGVSRSSRRHQVFFVNGRYIKSAYLAAAAEEALRGMGPAGRHPILVLNLTLDPALVDVNVHPAKHEVRFSRASEIYALVHRAVRRAVGRGLGVGAAGIPGPKSAVPASQREAPAKDPSPAFQVALSLVAEMGEEPEDYSVFPALRPLGLLPPAYLLFRGPDGLYLVDQHAAHERILYEKFLGVLGTSPGRQLVVPVTVEIRGREAEVLNECRLLLQRTGFEVEPFGEETFVVRAVPAFLEPGGEEALLRDILERLAGEKPLDDEAFGRVLAAALACRRAVRAGQTLAAEEMEGLVAELARTREPYTCPHGRPTLIKISYQELARRFGRE